MHSQENADWQMARSCVYSFLSGLLSDRPATETIRRLTSPPAVESIKSLFGDPEIGSGLHALAELSRSDRLSTEEVVLDFEGLMRVPGAAYTHPYESTYRNHKRCGTGADWSGLCGPQAADVERTYRDEGLEPLYDRVDFPDHIGAELSYMAHLCRRTAEAKRKQQVDMTEQLLSKQQQFAQNHLLTWAEDFSAELHAKAATPFFQVVAALLSAFIEVEKEQLAVH